MEQRNRLGALGYLLPLLLHSLLLFVADGERGNFVAAMGSGDPFFAKATEVCPLATAEEERKRQALSNPGVQPRLGVGRSTSAEEGRSSCGVRLGSPSTLSLLNRGGLKQARVGASQPDSSAKALPPLHPARPGEE